MCFWIIIAFFQFMMALPGAASEVLGITKITTGVSTFH